MSNNCRVNRRNTKGHFMKAGAVDPTILARIERSKVLKERAKQPRRKHTPEYERDLTHNPFAALLKG